jgi:hypothetical protein
MQVDGDEDVLKFCGAVRADMREVYFEVYVGGERPYLFTANA